MMLKCFFDTNQHGAKLFGRREAMLEARKGLENPFKRGLLQEDGR